MSPLTPSPPRRNVDSPQAPPPVTHAVRDRQAENTHKPEEKIPINYLNVLEVFVVLVTLYISFTSSPAFGLREQNASVIFPTGWLTATVSALSAIITTWRCYTVASQRLRLRGSEPQGPPTIQVYDFDPAGRNILAEEHSATSSGLSAAGTEVSGTLQPPRLQHPPESSPWRGALPAQPPVGSQSQSPGLPPVSSGVETRLLGVAHSQMTNAGYLTGTGGRHAAAPVEQTPRPSAWVQEATSHGAGLNPSQGATWGTSSENALRDWTLFLPLDRSLFGRVRKQPEDTRPIFSSPNCDVWRCDIEFSKPLSIHPAKVAVKVVRHYVRGEHDPVKIVERMNARLNQESITWAGVNHLNIVPLIGVIFSPIHALILPWYKHGNLDVYLSRYPAANRMKLIFDIARGLGHLHSRTPKIVQADIKPENILINDQGDALITDFGMSTVLGEDNWYTIQWMAPEILMGQSERRSRTGDVYSFGGLTCYIMTGRKPHDSRSQYQIIATLSPTVQDPIDRWHMHPQLQGRFGGSIAGIIRRCWSGIQRDRPTMQSIVGEMAALMEERRRYQVFENYSCTVTKEVS